MLHIVIDQAGKYSVSLPKSYKVKEIVRVAQTFVAYDGTLPAEAHSTYHADISSILAQANTAPDPSEVRDSLTSTRDRYYATRDEARLLAKQAWSSITAKLIRTPQQANEWGFTVARTGRNAGYIYLPNDLDEILTMFSRYIPKEQSLPETEQLAYPELSKVNEIYEVLQVLPQQQANELSQKWETVDLTESLCGRLMNQLRGALIELVVKRYDGVIDPALAQWGFAVRVQKRSGHDNGHSAIETPLVEDSMGIIPPQDNPVLETHAMMEYELGETTTEEEGNPVGTAD